MGEIGFDCFGLDLATKASDPLHDSGLRGGKMEPSGL
jgi:hypothetical protein